MAKYINPYTDFGFKKLFGEEGNKDLLTDFLNQLLPEKHKIADLSFKSQEKLGETATERKAIFDIHCQTKDGHQFIVEMQKAKINFFKDRAVFYSTFPLREQAEKGDWDFNLKPVYCIAILDFEFDKGNDNYVSNVQLKDQYCEIFYDKLNYIFIEMPRFKKSGNDLLTHFEKWLYFLKNLESFESIPEILNEPIFTKGFKIAEIAGYNQEQLHEYEESLKVYRDLKGVIDSSFDEGWKEGEKKGYEEGEKKGFEKGEKLGAGKRNKEIIMKMYNEGMSITDIARFTGVKEEEISRILHEAKK